MHRQRSAHIPSSAKQNPPYPFQTADHTALSPETVTNQKRNYITVRKHSERDHIHNNNFDFPAKIKKHSVPKDNQNIRLHNESFTVNLFSHQHNAKTYFRIRDQVPLRFNNLQPSHFLKRHNYCALPTRRHKKTLPFHPIKKESVDFPEFFHLHFNLFIFKSTLNLFLTGHTPFIPNADEATPFDQNRTMPAHTVK